MNSEGLKGIEPQRGPNFGSLQSKCPVVDVDDSARGAAGARYAQAMFAAFNTRCGCDTP